MKEREIKQKWFPFWVDKWIFGSMRIEFEPEERAIWIDLLCLASKDNGYIRANEETPYLIRQLAGILVIDEEKMERAINKFIKKKKLTKTKSGTLLVTKWDKYQLSESYLRVKRYRAKKSKDDKPLQRNDKPLPYNNIKNIKNIHNNNIKEKVKTSSLFEKDFDEFWELYPRKTQKQAAKETFMIRCRQGLSSKIIEALKGYLRFLKYQRTQNNFDQAPMYPKTFLNKNRWEEFLNFKHTEAGQRTSEQTPEEAEYWKAREAKEKELKKQGLDEETIQSKIAVWSNNYWGARE